MKKDLLKRVVVSMGVVLLLGSTIMTFGVRAQEKKAPWAGKTVKVLAYGQSWCFHPLIRKDGTKTPLLLEFERNTGVRVDFEFYDEDVVRTKAMLDLASHTGQYDLLASEVWLLPGFAGYIESLESYIRDWQNPEYFSLSDFPAASLDACRWKGRLYSLPIYEFSAGTIYRKDLLRKYGIEVPVDMEEFTQAVKKLTLDTNGDGETDIYGITGRGRKGEEPTITATGYAWAYGGSWFEGNAHTTYEIEERKAKPTVNTPEFIAGYEKYCGLLRDYGDPGQSNWSYVEANKAFSEGRAAFYVDATTLHFVLRDIVRETGRFDPDDVGLAPSPVGPAGRHVQSFWSFQFCINQDSEVKLAAWQVLQFLASQQFQEAGAKLGSNSSPRLDILDSEVLKKILGAEVMATLIKIKTEFTQSEYMPLVPEYAELCDILGTAASIVISGEKTTKEALEDANKAMYEVMEIGGYYR